jgi:hypothetical protein
MESVKQTATEWLIEQLKKPYSDKYIMDIIDQAKAMEKEQISQAYTTGVEEDVWNNPLRTGEMYYNETYGNNK